MEMKPHGETAQDTISFAELSGGVLVVRVYGRGSFANSVELKDLADHVTRQLGAGEYRFIIDLKDCSTMDSTFMGVLASVGLRQKRESQTKLAVVNANEQSTRLLDTLGLSHFIDVRRNDSGIRQAAEAVGLQDAPACPVSKAERIIHMIEAHENLVDADSQNAVRFESVLKYLRESLDREKDT